MAPPRQSSEAVRVQRLLIMCLRPSQLSAGDAEAWLRRELDKLISVGDFGRAALSELQSVSLAWGREWDWLVELELTREDPEAAVARGSALNELLLDLRLLGMRPTVAMTGDVVELAGAS